MLKDELPDDLLEFLQSDRRLAYDAAACEIGAFTLRATDEIEEINLLVGAENGDGACVMRGLDLVKTCEEYDPRGMLVYIPSLRKYGSSFCARSAATLSAFQASVADTWRRVRLAATMWTCRTERTIWRRWRSRKSSWKSWRSFPKTTRCRRLASPLNVGRSFTESQGCLRRASVEYYSPANRDSSWKLSRNRG